MLAKHQIDVMLTASDLWAVKRSTAVFALQAEPLIVSRGDT